MKKEWNIIGIIALVVGIFLLAMPYVPINFPASLMSTTPRGERVGISLTTDVKSYPYPLSTTPKGQTYKWEVTAKNTGTVDWSDSWVTVRVGIKGSTVTTKTESGVKGAFAVEQCSYGTDVPSCKVDIGSSGWNLQYFVGSCSESKSWITPEIQQKVGSVVFSSIPAGQSKKACFKLSVPANAEDGNYPLITNLQAYASGTWHVAHKTDNLSVGTVSGDLVLQMIGVLSIFAGLALIGKAFFK